jgi:hypothetical protein
LLHPFFHDVVRFRTQYMKDLHHFLYRGTTISESRTIRAIRSASAG